jgi:hypothetical protein
MALLHLLEAELITFERLGRSCKETGAFLVIGNHDKVDCNHLAERETYALRTGFEENA